MKIISKLPGVGVRRLVLRLWHSVWRDYWNERMDDPVCYTDTSGMSHAMRRYNYHLNRWHETFPQNA
jgi:hypothetical protein